MLKWSRTFRHPSDSTPRRFIAWLLLSSLGVALTVELLGHTIGPFPAFGVALAVVSLGSLIVTPASELEASVFVFIWAFPLGVIGLFVLVFILLEFEPHLRFLPIWGTAGSRDTFRMPLVYRLLFVFAWLGYAGFEVRRFRSLRARSAA